jgi:hypothetical protein
VDYVRLPPGKSDPTVFNEAKFLREIRNWINALKVEDPEKAKLYEDTIFKRNEIDEILAEKVDLSEIKVYPGSDKGPLPEDDVDHYSKWFVENQPKSLMTDGIPDFDDLGVKRRFITITRDDSESNEHLHPAEYWLENEDDYPNQGGKGLPEFALFNRSSYNVNDEDELPALILTTTMGVNELPPLPSEHTYNYQEVMYELERWTIFKALPGMLNYDKLMLNAINGI